MYPCNVNFFFAKILTVRVISSGLRIRFYVVNVQGAASNGN